VPLGPRDDARLATAGRALDEVRPQGNTPLFRAMVDGVGALTDGEPGPAERSPGEALVVLTDGQDTTSGITAADTAGQIADRGVRIVVATVGEIRCSDPGLTEIIRTTGGSCVDAEEASLDEQVAEIVAGLRGGR